MGLYKGKVQSLFTSPYILPIADEKKGSTYQGRRYEQKRYRKEKKKLSIQKHKVPRLGLGGLSHKNRRAELPEGRNMLKNIKGNSI
jgi:hypothetical protein